MADFSHHSLLLKMPHGFLPHEMEHDLITNGASTSNQLPSFLFYSASSHDHHDHAAVADQDASLETSSVVLGTPPHATASADNKRKCKEHNSATLSSAHCKDSKESKSRRAKRPSNKEVEEKEGPPKGYIHVRARRGQATDSHSLAERVRRERISERMRMLQALVPGCDKVTGKALVLDEIINYVQSLQNQVEFLSMRIASMSPVLYGFGLDTDALSDQTQKIGGVFQEAPAMPPQAIMDNTSTTTYSLQGQEAMSFTEGNGSYLMMQTAGEPRQELLNQVVFNNMCSFQ